MSHAVEGRHAETADEGRGASIARIAWGTFLVAAAVVVVSAVYLRPFLDDPARSPHGVGTPGSVQRTLLVSELGLNELGERPAHPIVTSILRDVAGGAPLDLARMWPTIFAVAIALAGAALGAGVAGERRWVGAALGVGIAASPFVALAAIGDARDLVVDLFAVAAVALAVRVRAGGRGAIALILLIGAAAIAQGGSAGLLVALLGTYAAGVALATWRRRGDDRSRWRDPLRLLLAVGLGAVLGAVLLLASPERPDRLPPTPRAATDDAIAARPAQMALGATIPLAAVGGAVMWASRRPATTRVLPPLALWALAAPAGLIAWRVVDTTMPLRFVPLALGVPALIVLGAGATRAWTDAMDGRPDRATWVRAGAVASAVLVVAATAWLAARGSGAWMDAQRGFTEEQFEQASILAAYAEVLPPETRIVVPMKPGERRPLSALMIALPIERFLDVEPWRVNFAGDRARFRERLASRYPDAVAVHLEGYSDQPPLGGRRLGPGVRLLAGPAFPAALPVRPAGTSEAGDLMRLTVTSIATLLVVGLGWAIALTGFHALAVVCISPAVGVAMLALGGFLAGRLGVPLGGGVGVLVAMAVGLLGGLAVLIERRRSDGTDEPEPQPALASPLWLAPMGGRHLAGDRGVRSE